MKSEISKVRYFDIIFKWDDESSRFSPEVDIDEPTPMVSNGYWHGIIDIINHRLADCDGFTWPSSFQSKVRDGGIYTLLDEEHNPICIYRGYVPNLPFGHDCWEDYIRLFVNCNGEIEDWHSNFDFTKFIEDGRPISKEEYQRMLEFYLTPEKSNTERDADMVQLAAEIMIAGQKRQRDKAGQPYFFHPMRVAIACETAEQKQVALLHDIIEDTDATPEWLKQQGFSDKVVDAVMSVTKEKGENYEAFIIRCSLNPLGRYVKIRDLKDNLNVTRLSELGYSDTTRVNKYLKALRFLEKI